MTLPKSYSNALTEYYKNKIDSNNAEITWLLSDQYKTNMIAYYMGSSFAKSFQTLEEFLIEDSHNNNERIELWKQENDELEAKIKELEYQSALKIVEGGKQ